MTRAVLLAALLLSGCSQSVACRMAWCSPMDTVALAGPELDVWERTRRAWDASGLPSSAACTPPRILWVDTYEDAGRACNWPSPRGGCYRQRSDGAGRWMVVPREHPSPLRAIAHESVHGVRTCVLGSGDDDHSDPRLWGPGATVEARAKEGLR